MGETRKNQNPPPKATPRNHRCGQSSTCPPPTCEPGPEKTKYSEISAQFLGANLRPPGSHRHPAHPGFFGMPGPANPRRTRREVLSKPPISPSAIHLCLLAFSILTDLSSPAIFALFHSFIFPFSSFFFGIQTPAQLSQLSQLVLRGKKG